MTVAFGYLFAQQGDIADSTSAVHEDFELVLDDESRPGCDLIEVQSYGPGHSHFTSV